VTEPRVFNALPNLSNIFQNFPNIFQNFSNIFQNISVDFNVLFCVFQSQKIEFFHVLLRCQQSPIFFFAISMALQERSTHSSLTVEKATDKLVDASEVIKRRGDIKDSEKKRVKEAFKLLARGVSTTSRGAKQQKLYLGYLKRAQELLGNSAVVLSAVGLGQSAIANTKDRVRVDLPFALKERQDDIVNDVLQGLADSYATG
jgi:hypothetical protein